MKRYLISIIVVVLFSGCDNALQKKMVNDQMNTIYDQVVQDSIDQYNITKSAANHMDMCVHAGMVKAAMLQAKNNTGYNEWDTIEKEDCDRAGVPR